MKKIAPALVGTVIVVMLSLCYLLQPQVEKAVSSRTPSSTTMETSTAGKVDKGSKMATADNDEKKTKVGKKKSAANSSKKSAADISGKKTANSSKKSPADISGKKAASGSKKSAAVSSSGTQKSDTSRMVAAAASPIKVSDAEGIVAGGYIHVKVTRIVDGDTIKAKYESKEYKVRLLCIDTPETVKEGLPVQPYGKQASEKLSGILLNKQVTLAFEKDLYDKYDRLLAYVILKDGTCVNAFMIEQGYARVEAVKPNTVYRDYFEGLQEEAIRNKRGLWSLPIDKRPFVKKDEGYYVPRFYDEAA